MTDCIFCKIAAGNTPTKFIYEDDEIVVFPDLHPKAETHLLVTPKEHINSLNEIRDEHTKLIAHMINTLPRLARQLGLHGFRTVINTGKDGGQEINHLHVHFLAGSLPRF